MFYPCPESVVLFLDLWLIYLKTSLPFGIAQGLLQELVFINNLTGTRPSVKNYLASKHICERWKFRLIEVEKSKPPKKREGPLLSLSFWTVSNKQTNKKNIMSSSISSMHFLFQLQMWCDHKFQAPTALTFLLWAVNKNESFISQGIFARAFNYRNRKCS